MGALNLPPEERPANAVSDGGPTKEQVAALRMPFLFVEGAEDIVVPPPVVTAVHELIPGSLYREVPGCGHSVYWEAPETFNDIVEQFLSTNL